MKTTVYLKRDFNNGERCVKAFKSPDHLTPYAIFTFGITPLPNKRRKQIIIDSITYKTEWI